jgi:GT2 family glycosyltransferase
MESQVEVAVVILTCDQKEVTLRCLSSFENVDRDGVGILVWDNGSTDGTKAAIKKRYPEVEVQRIDQNLGVAGGRNAGASAAKELWDPEFLLFLDNDTVVTSDLVWNLRRPFREDSDVGITTPKVLFLDDPERIDAAGGCRVHFWLGETPAVGSGEIDRGQCDVRRECVPGGCCMLTKTELFRELDGFDLRYNPFLLEDIDFSLRVKDAGYGCTYVPDAVIYHDESQTFEKGSYTQRYAYQKAKNWYYFVQRHATPMEKMGFWLIGVPWRLLSAAVREVRRGNLTAMKGLLNGGWSTLIGRSKD